MVRRNITGPRSALTDYLASQNISVARIRGEASERRRAAEEAEAAHAAEASNATEQSAPPGQAPVSSRPTRSALRTRHLNEQQQDEVLAGQPASKKRKKSKASKKPASERDTDDDDDSDIVKALERHRPTMPGQIAWCEDCGKRFTVTPYSRSGSGGGLLCPECSRALDRKEKALKKRAPRNPRGAGGGRRKVQSSMLDGTFHLGAKSLVRLSLETLAKNINLAEDLGELPQHIIDKISRLFSKRRLLNPTTLPLFVQPTVETLSLYDGAYLGTEDLIGILQICSRLKELKLRNVIHFKDEVMAYLLGRHIKLEVLSLHGANLLSESSWIKFLNEKAECLTTLQVYATDKHFGDKVVALLPKSCPRLARLKIDGNQELTSDGVNNIGEIKSLQHLSLRLMQPIRSQTLVSVINGVGPNLRTLSLEQVEEATDGVLEAISDNCVYLEKLRITGSRCMTDTSFAKLFAQWRNSPLRFIDFETCRALPDVDEEDGKDEESEESEEDEKDVGLGSEGFRALMKHSGHKIVELNVASCRIIDKEAFEEAFGEDRHYPELEDVDVSFCEAVDDFIVGSIMRCCPALQKLKVFGCMRCTSEVTVPLGVTLIGVPNALSIGIMGGYDY